MEKYTHDSKKRVVFRMMIFLAIIVLVGVILCFLQKPGVFTKIRISPSNQNSFYSAITRHQLGESTFSLHSESVVSNAVMSRSRGETDSRLINEPKTLPAPEITGIYDVEWAYGFRKAPLIVSANPDIQKSKIAVLVPDYTWQAYNVTGGKSLYSEENVVVSLDRPLGELFSELFFRFHIRNLPIFEPRDIRMHEPAFNPIKFITEKYGSPDVISQSILVDNYASYDLSKYEVIVLYGHDEYWPPLLKQEITDAVSNGTGLLNMSGNTSWWWTEIGNRTIKRTKQWYEAESDSPEESLLGVSFRFAGYPLAGKYESDIPDNVLLQLESKGFPVDADNAVNIHKSNGFRITNAADRLFKGTGLSNGDWLGSEVGVNFGETDGWPLQSEDKGNSAISNQMIENSLSPLAESWAVSRRTGDWKVNHSASIVRQNYGNGEVISLATIGWVKALLKEDPLVEIITSNAIDELLERKK